MEKELNQAAEAGFRFQGVMGGETAFGGDEVVVILERDNDAEVRDAAELVAIARRARK